MPHGMLILLMNSVLYFHLLLAIILTPYHFGFCERALNLVYLSLYHWLSFIKETEELRVPDILLSNYFILPLKLIVSKGNENDSQTF